MIPLFEHLDVFARNLLVFIYSAIGLLVGIYVSNLEEDPSKFDRFAYIVSSITIWPLYILSIKYHEGEK